jgi:hypothetical protein
MLLYKDGRFAKDPMWSFFALNYSSRRKNQQSGGYFVNGFFKDGPQTLEDLQQNISSGDTNWIDRISYFSKTVKGSPGYWRAKRKEVFSWINYHLEKGHGPPSFFITLSCAEYHWQDIKRLIKERLVKADIEHDDFENNFVKYVNEYSIVVQEYFQARVQIWLDTIGKHVFKIKHYWVRFEFAPSRGQIHAHMIVIADTQEMMKLISRAPSNEKKAELLAMWVEESFAMTAELKIPEEEHNIENLKHPSQYNFSETLDSPSLDIFNCLNKCQQHVCSKYCLRKRK